LNYLCLLFLSNKHEPVRHTRTDGQRAVRITRSQKLGVAHIE